MELLSAFSTDELQALVRETGDCSVQEDEIRILELLVLAWVCESNGDAKKLIAQGAISVNEQLVSDIGQKFSRSDAVNWVLLIRKGKKNYKIVQF